MAKKDRTGEVIQTKYGPAKIIQYNSYHDMTVLFDGHGIKEHISYSALIKDEVLPPGTKKKIRVTAYSKKDRTGEVVQTKYGPAKIIQYKSCHDVTVLFDGHGIREHVRYAALVRGKVLPPGIDKKDRTGEVVQTKYGPAKIIQYNSYHDMTVLFDGHGIKEHISYSTLIKDEVLPPGMDKMVKKDRTGEVVQTKYGPAKIVQYNSSTDMTVLFDGHGIKEHVRYCSLANDKALPPGAKRDNRAWQVRRAHEQAILGKAFHTTRCGNCTVAKYKDSQNVTVRFEDGTLIGTTVSALYRGHVNNPNHIYSKYIGVKSTTYNGIPFTITDVVKIKKDTDHCAQWIVTVKFIDKSKRTTTYSPAKVIQGNINHPSFQCFGRTNKNPYEKKKGGTRTFLDYEIYGKAFETKTSVYYYCRKKDSLEQMLDVLTPKEMIERSRQREQTV